MTHSRDEILGRVREALKIPSKRPQATEPTRPETQSAGAQLPIVDGRADRQFLPKVGETFEERWELFCELSEKLKTRTHLVPDVASAKQVFDGLLKAEGWSKIGCMKHDLVGMIVAGAGEQQYVVEPGRFDKFELENCCVGVSGCDALISQTASVLVSPNSAGGRSLSVLPPHHVVIATADQMVATLVDGFDVIRQNYPDGLPSFMSLITGPSRTGDIERVLVLGAHGPKKLDVIVIQN